MARRRPPAPAKAGAVPRALTDHDNPLWTDQAAFLALCDTTGIQLNPDLATGPWWARFDAFRTAWCRFNGITNPTWPNLIDYQRAVSAGVDLRSLTRHRIKTTGPTD